MSCLLEIKEMLKIEENVEFINEGEGYYISTNDNGYLIKYNELRDAMKALLTIKAGVNEINYKGRGHFKELGYMIDLSRNAVLNMPTMKKLIRLLSALGYNQLYLYMEDTYEVEGEPYFGLYRGRYSIAELKEIDDYATKFGLEAIPCIQTLAHLGEMFKWENYQDIKDIDNILLVGSDRTYTLITNMIKSLRMCFKTKKIHIGMDEAHNLGLGKYLDKFGYHDRFEIMDYHIKRVNSICKQYDFKPMIWSDMFFRLAFHGNYYQDSDVSLEILNKIPKDIELVYWDYYQTEKEKYDSMINKHKKITKDIRFAGGAWKWMGFAPNNRFSLNTSYHAIKSLIANKIDKVMVTAWGDDGAEASLFSSFPTVVYYGICNYMGSMEIDSLELKNQFKALMNSEFDDFVNLDILNEPNGKENYKGFENPSKYLLYNDVLEPKFDYMVKEGFNDYYKEAALKLNEMALRNKEYSYIFTNLSNLSRILSLKAELGKDIYRNYHEGSDIELKIDVAYLKSLIEYIEDFYKSFKNQWFIENKHSGFDTHIIRLKGLEGRIEYAAYEVHNFQRGYTLNIEELEEPRRDPLEGSHDNDISYNQWGLIVTANKLIGF